MTDPATLTPSAPPLAPAEMVEAAVPERPRGGNATTTETAARPPDHAALRRVRPRQAPDELTGLDPEKESHTRTFIGQSVLITRSLRTRSASV